MSLSSTLSAYRDCQNACDRALASDHGITVSAPSAQRREQFYRRLHAFRALDRKENAQMLGPDGPQSGPLSPYDILTFSRPRTRPLDIDITINSGADLQISDLGPALSD